MRHLILLFVSSFLLGGGPGQGAPRRIVFLHTSDVHGHVFGDEAKAVGGYPALDTALGEARRAAFRQGARLWLSDSGDAFQGTPVVNESRGRVMVAGMNAMRYHMGTFGNHSFDYGQEVLRARMDESRHLWVSSNVDFPWPHPRRRRWWIWQPWLGSHRPAPRIAFVGATIETTPSKSLPDRIEGMGFHEARTQLAPLLRRLRKEHDVDMVVLLSHLGVDRDLDLANAGLGIDLIFGGHDHLEEPVLRRVGSCGILYPGAYGMSFGQVELVWDDETRKIVSVEGGSRRLDHGRHPPGAPMKAILEPFHRAVAERMAVRICRLPVDVPKGVRGGPAPVAELVAAALRAEAGTDLAFMNFGGVRQGLDRGELLRGEAHRALPFGNWLVTGRMKGRALRDLLESAVDGEWGEADEDMIRFYRERFATRVRGWLPLKRERGFLCAAGLRASFDPRRPEGRRILEIHMADGSPFQEERSYTVALNNFLHEGGDGFAAFRDVEDVEIHSDAIDVDLLCRALAHMDVKAVLAEPSMKNLALELGTKEMR